uniref:G_PROTEIN_RECEP_F2_4 domain-containing protein n=2 Tax=Caenorhabditis japonica TaxID=281687 RepID=A0A8R1EUH6_CAEJA
CNKFPVTDLCVGKNSSNEKSPPKKSADDVTFGVSTIASEVVLSPKKCPHVMHTTSGSHFSLPLLSGRLPECSLTCEADNQVPMMFDGRVRRILRIWTAAWSVACFVCSLFTLTTFLVDLSRFAYPVRPILYLAFCYLAISLVFMIGVVGEDGFACGAYGSTPTILVTQGGENVGCSALAVVHYFFFMASCAWWLVLCLAWFLAANLKWGAESIAALSPYFHAMCWGGPAILSVTVLVTNSVDGDVFTGICSVGNLNPKALVYFFFTPIVVSLGERQIELPRFLPL